MLEHSALPSYGSVYLNQLVGEFRSLKAVCADAVAMAVAEEIVKRAESGALMTWGDAYTLDDAIARMLPVEYLYQRAWCLENRYRDAVGNAAAYDAFMKIDAPQLVNETEIHLRARVHNMLRELYRLYTVTSCREDMRDTLSRQARTTLNWIFFVIAILFLPDVLALHFGALKLWSFDYLDVWGLVFLAGAAGGLISLQRRIQALPNSGESLSDLVELSSRATIKFTPIIGGTFAVVLFLVFCSGLITGPMFPTPSSKTGASGFLDFVAKVQPGSAAEWGKLFVWSFIAGFAETLVPDTLDRLIAKSQVKTATK